MPGRFDGDIRDSDKQGYNRCSYVVLPPKDQLVDIEGSKGRE